jgi:ANTAR domain/GAF domain
VSLSTTRFHHGLVAIAAADALPRLLEAVHEAVQAVGGAGTSLGLVVGDRVRQSARGFPREVGAAYATFPLAEELPGPEVVRTGQPDFAPDRAATLARYPGVAPIVESSAYDAAACVPLVRDGETFGYLAVHYVGPRDFDAAERFLLTSLAAATAGSAWRLTHHDPGTAVAVATDADAGAEAGAGEVDHLRDEVRGLTTAMASRAVIEQAKGMLMQRYSLTSEAAWQLLIRLSSATNTKVRDLAEQCVRGDAALLQERDPSA